MNKMLELKGTFQYADRTGSAGGRILPTNTSVEVEHLNSLANDLKYIRDNQQNNEFVNGIFISATYIRIMAKSNRINALLRKNATESPNTYVVGAKFSNKTEETKHVITYYVDHVVVDKSIKLLEATIHIVKNNFNDKITDNIINNLKNFDYLFKKGILSRSTFQDIIVDAYYVESFQKPTNEFEFRENSIVTIYNTEQPTIELLKKIGIRISEDKIIDKTTICLIPDDFKLLKEKAPYLISMALTDFSKQPTITFEESINTNNHNMDIPKPKNEPTIGVIDTHFDKNVYFSEWVDYTNMLLEDIDLDDEDYEHGTAVSSIIVDGPALNPKLDDGCKRFRVKHFGVAKAGRFSSFSILKSIEQIIATNKNIKVWNLSLGSNLEINENFVSPEAALLDKIQSENDVVFIVAGTNNNDNIETQRRIGAPADSINSLVVNAVDFKNNSASYTRVGPVLSFFQKPDISYYGGDVGQPIQVCTSLGQCGVYGTSFAAPWIARKMSYLIDVLGMTREVAKALIIHSSTTWEQEDIDPLSKGYGVVPIRIEDIVQSKNDEIQFILRGVSEKFNTYSYTLPVPVHKNTHPFIAKATMCYFPHCSRNQGVDYTDTEFDLYFGRINGTSIKTINQNKQIDEGTSYLREDMLRKQFRKWDNIKHIIEYYTDKKKAKKAYDSKLWGISVKTKDRLKAKSGIGMNFGIVVTLKEINGVNRIDEFKKLCFTKNWLVNEINIDNKLEIYNLAEEEIDFDM